MIKNSSSKKTIVNKPAISVIVPVYNVEKYIIRCVTSVLDQSFKNYELIIVDDCTPCNSIKLAREYFAAKKQQKNIKIITRSANGGLGAARNTGIENAEGDYLFFLDSDDWLQTEGLQKLYSKIEQSKADVVAADYFTATDQIAYPAMIFKAFTDKMDERSFVMNYNPGAWNKLYRTRLFKENSIKFPEEKQWYEDLATIPLILAISKKVTILNEAILYYYQRADSIMGETRKGNLKIFDIFRSCDRLIENRRLFTREEWRSIEDNLSFHCGAARLDDIIAINKLSNRFAFIKLLYKHLNNTLPSWSTSNAITSHYLNYKSQSQCYKKTFASFAKGNLLKALLYSLFIKKITSHKPKILFAIPTLSIGGAEKVFTNMLFQLDLAKFDVTVYVYEKTGPLETLLPKENIRVIHRNHYKNDLYYRPFLNTLFDGQVSFSDKLFKCKTAIVNNIISREYSYNKFVKRFSDLPYTSYDAAIAYTDLTPDMSNFVLHKINSGNKIIWVHNDFNPTFLNYIDDRLFEKSFGGFNSIACVSSGAANSLSKRFPSIDKKIRVINNFLDIEEIRSKALKNISYKFDKGVLNLISVGRIDMHTKGYDRIISIASRLKKEGYQFKWHIVGNGPDMDALKNLSNSYEVDDIFIFHGSQLNPYPFIKAADVLILPSRFEAYPTVVLEAHTLGTPCLVARNSGTEDQFKKITELVVDNTDFAIYDGLKRLLSDKELQQKMKKQVQTYIYDNEIIKQKVYELFGIEIQNNAQAITIKKDVLRSIHNTYSKQTQKTTV